jgi:hypothetical protein
MRAFVRSAAWYSGSTVKNYYKHWRQFFASPQVKEMVEKIPFIVVRRSESDRGLVRRVILRHRDES